MMMLDHPDVDQAFNTHPLCAPPTWPTLVLVALTVDNVRAGRAPCLISFMGAQNDLDCRAALDTARAAWLCAAGNL